MERRAEMANKDGKRNWYGKADKKAKPAADDKKDDKKPKAADADDKAAAKSPEDELTARHMRERDDVFARHGSERDDDHKRRQKEIEDMVKRHFEELDAAQAARGAADGQSPEELDASAGVTNTAQAGAAAEQVAGAAGGAAE